MSFTSSFNFKNYSYKQWFLLWIFLFVIKFIQIWWLWELTLCNSPEIVSSFLSNNAGDFISYIVPFDNLYEKRVYYIFSGSENVYAGRMPVYGFLYYVLRHFIENKETIFIIQVILQLALECTATLLLCQIIFKITKLEYCFWIGFFIFTISLYWTNFSFNLTPESVGLSFLIFSLFFYQLFKETFKIKHLFISGMFTAILVGLKPYFIIIIFLIALDLFIYTKGTLKYKSAFTMRMLMPLSFFSIPLFKPMGHKKLYAHRAFLFFDRTWERVSII